MVLGYESRHDAVVGLTHGGIDVFWSLADRVDGLMDGQAQGVPVDEMPVVHTGQDVEGAVDGQRYDGQLQLVGQREGTFAERAHVARERAGTFGEDGDGVTLAQDAAGVVVGFFDLAHATLVDHNLVGLATGIAHKGNLLYLVFHHPLEVAAQETVDEEDVEGTLMVGHEDVRLVLLQMLATFDSHRDKEGAEDNPGPPAAGIIAPEMAVANGGADANRDGGDDGDKDDDGNTNQKLIETIQVFHFLRNVMTTISGGTPKRKGMTPLRPVETLIARSPI